MTSLFSITHSPTFLDIQSHCSKLSLKISREYELLDDGHGYLLSIIFIVVILTWHSVPAKVLGPCMGGSVPEG